MIGYSFFLDSDSMANANENDIIPFIEELYEMVSGATDHETFIHPFPVEFLNRTTSDGKEINQIIYSYPDYRIADLVRYIQNKLKIAKQAFSHPNDMDVELSHTHNAFIGIIYPPEIKSDRHITSTDEKLIFITSHTIVIPQPDFWQSRDTLFPRIVFCNVPEETITGEKYRDYFEKTFKDIQSFCENTWLTGSFNLQSFQKTCIPNASDESDSVYNDPKLRAFRESNIPNNGKQFWPLHIKKGGNLRIHFWPDNKNRKIYITYIGRHLPTKKYK